MADDRPILVKDQEGRSTFNYILQQIEICIKDISLFFRDLTVEQVYSKEFYPTVLKFLEIKNNMDLKQLAHCDIAYNIVFFGVSRTDINILNRLLYKHYNPIFIQYILFYISKKPHIDSLKYESWRSFQNNYFNDFVESYYSDITKNTGSFSFVPKQFLPFDPLSSLMSNDYYKFYGGHQYKLGHYYRHLFQSVKYINEQKILSYIEKYEYIATLRAQLSTPEQYMLFFNSISLLGRNWELNHLINLNGTERVNINKCLITKYNMIKNIPDWFVFERIDIRNFYPEVTFETYQPSDSRLKLNKLYK